MKAIGLDIGTTSISCVLMDAESGEQLGSVTLPNDTALEPANAWEREQHPERILSKCMDAVSGFVKGHGDIGCIGITGQMHGMLYYNSHGEALSPLYTWEDGRGDLVFSDGETYAEALSRLTGYRMATGYGLTTHFYNMKNGLVPEGALGLCTIADYVAMRLCGKSRAATHTTNGAGFGVFDMNKLEFDKPAMEKAGIDPNLLPVIIKTEKIIGKTHDGSQ